MDPVHRAVGAFLRTAALRRTTPVLVACSGGGDSVALLHALAHLGQRVGSCHVHHGTRGAEADADLDFARACAAALGVPFFGARVDAAERDGDSPEARSRRLRYAALERVRAAGEYGWVATAHTQDDQAETLLLRATRGCDIAGLAGIALIDRERRLLRPLLEVRRDELRRYLADRGIRWREDATNADLRVPRNRLRADVLPVLEELAPGAAARLARLATAARETEGLVADEVSRWLAAHATTGDGGVWLDRTALAAAPGALRRRALARALRLEGLGDRVSRAVLERLDAFVGAGGSGRRWSVGRGATLVLDGDAAWLGPEPGPRYPRPFAVELRPPAPLERPERDLRLTWRSARWRSARWRSARWRSARWRSARWRSARWRSARRSAEAAQAGRNRAQSETRRARSERSLWLPRRPGRVIARSPRQGDRLRVAGAAGSRALVDIFADACWSRRARARAVVVERDREVVWVVGLASAAVAEPSASGWELSAEPFLGSGQLLESSETSRP